ncbi:glycosyltransferase family 2 protein [Morganella morganii]|nr:glycosyltransferase family 2 protein [Morganella morganii]
MIKISVIIPTFNSERTIELAIRSVLKQTYKIDEIIIIDDFSSDETVNIVKNLCLENKNIILYQNIKNLGAAASRNNGFRHAKNKYIAFLDSDDSWLPNKIEKQLHIMSTYNCDVVSTNFFNGEIKKSTSPEKIKISNISTKNLMFKNYLSTPSVLLKLKNDLYFDSNLRYCEDYQYWLQLSMSQYRICYTSEKLVLLGKPSYGVSGLSSQILKMQLGESKALFTCRKKHPLLFCFALIFSWLKFIKRVIVTFYRRMK